MSDTLQGWRVRFQPWPGGDGRTRGPWPGMIAAITPGGELLQQWIGPGIPECLRDVPERRDRSVPIVMWRTRPSGTLEVTIVRWGFEDDELVGVAHIPQSGDVQWTQAPPGGIVGDAARALVAGVHAALTPPEGVDPMGHTWRQAPPLTFPDGPVDERAEHRLRDRVWTMSHEGRPLYAFETFPIIDDERDAIRARTARVVDGLGCLGTLIVTDAETRWYPASSDPRLDPPAPEPPVFIRALAALLRT